MNLIPLIAIVTAITIASSIILIGGATLGNSAVNTNGTQTINATSFPVEEVAIAPVSTPATMSVVRMTGLPEPTEESKWLLVNDQTLAKYPALQTAMRQVDDQYEKFLNICATRGKCLPNSLDPWWEKPSTLQVSADLANALIADHDFNFKKFSSEFYVANIKSGDKVYGITITGNN